MPLFSSRAEDSRTNLFEERGYDAIQQGASDYNEQLKIPIEDSRTNPFEERGNDAVQFDATNENEDSKNVINLIWAENGLADHIVGLEAPNERAWTMGCGFLGSFPIGLLHPSS